MAFDPRTLINVSKELQTGTTEAHYRSIINRAYYGAFGYIRNKLSIFVDTGSVHMEVIKTLANSESVNKRKISKRLETLFKKRKDADYKHNEQVKLHNCKFCIDEAEDLVKLFDEVD
ncbi:hypothetical protein SanaruYs_26690 [Chryseotalea sanaruensis]|uniref:HEPN domain-containing protein n=1 Tax=Chryseotalea sanaruensis TaxID=2482724 RepID=A0A401UC29_9BACT|nr:hypothetical protein [Chryseotalea sanaruensis]GCC52432.1 hypothetical protein SanaruYs_26690 [Chryseotalea sanaruensis]